MKIVELRAENVKRLRAVEIRPDGELVVIGGRNAQGKSSVLDAIWLALGGGKASKETPVPIRDGEDKASVRLDLGDLVVTRSWTHKGSSLKVESADGAQYRSPQSMLDKLVGQLSFDPLAFTRLSPREQREALMRLVDLDIDLDALDQQIRDTYENRTRIGREGTAIGDIEVDDDLPDRERSAQDLIARIREAEEHNREVERAQRNLDAAVKKVEDLTANVERLKTDLAIAQDEVDGTLEFLKGALVRDVAPLEAELAGVEESNQRIRANNAARDKARLKEELRTQYDAATAELARLETVKLEGLRAAKFPITGLSFTDDGVTYRGVPLSQASSAEQIKVSLAMGMALNPTLRVLMIKDGSLLDADSMAAIRQQITDGDYQLWVEVVTPDADNAVIIEDGQVARP